MNSNAIDLGTETEHKADNHGSGCGATPDPFGDEENVEFRYRTMTWW